MSYFERRFNLRKSKSGPLTWEKASAGMKPQLAYRLLEPRMVFDGAMAPTADVIEQLQPDAGAIAAATADPATTIIFVDGAVAGRDALIAGLPAGARVVILDGERDGLAQMAEALRDITNLSSIHVLSHGEAGQITLGATTLTRDNAAQFAGQLGIIGSALSLDGDIQFYGCNVAATAGGTGLVSELGRLTGADIAASIDDTGASAIGGNWLLEHTNGAIESQALSVVDWTHVLAVNANDDTATISANATAAVTGNVLTNDATSAGTKTLTAVHAYADRVGQAYQTSYGTITMRADGTYSYVVDRTNSTLLGLTSTQSITDIIAYSMRNTAGEIDHGYLTVRINGVTDPLIAYDNSGSVTAGGTLVRSGNVITDNDGGGTDVIDRPLSQLVWENQFGANASISGTTRTIDGVAVTMTTSDPSRVSGAGNFTVNTGTQGGHTGYLYLAVDAPSRTYTAPAATFAFSQAVMNLEFTLTDLDSLLPSWQDQVKVTATRGGVPVSYTAQVAGTLVQPNSTTFYGTGGVASTDANANVHLVFDGPVDRVVISFNDGPGATAANPGFHVVGVSDLSWQKQNGEKVTHVNAVAVPPAGQSYTGTYGSVTVFPDGTYTYTLNDTLPAVIALPQGGTLTDTFVYTVTDFAGLATANANLVITINGRNEAPSLDLNGAAAGTSYSTNYTEGAAGVAITSGALIADVDTGSRTTSAQVTLTNVQSGDTLSVAGTLPAGISVSSFDPATGILTLSGNASRADYQTALGQIRFSNASEIPDTTPRTINIAVNDDRNAVSNTAVATINVVSVDDAPVNTVPGAQSLAEDTTRVFSTANGNAISIADVDAGTGTVTTTISVTTGALTLGTVAGVTATGNGTGTVVITGTPAAITAALNGLTYAPPANFNGAATITVSTNDNGNTGTGGPLTDVDTIALTITPVNDAPVNSVPATTQSTSEDTPRVFSTTNGNAISVADIDGGEVTTTLSIPNGTLTLSGVTGLTSVSGNGTGTVTVRGTAAAINAALNGLSFAPTADFNGATTLSVSTTDGIATDNDTVAVSVTAVADIANDTATTAEDVPVNIAVLGNDSFENAGRAITAINGASIAPGGSITVTNGSVRLEANGTLTFTPAANYNGPASFSYTVTSGGVTETATVTVAVTPVNDAPTQSIPAAQSTPEDTAVVFSSANNNAITVADLDGGNVTTTLTATNGILNVAAAAGVTIGGNGTGVITLTGTPAAVNAVLNGLSYTPRADYNGAANISIATTDGVLTANGSIPLTVTPVADIANNVAVTDEDTAVTISVLGNDTFEDATRVITAVQGQPITTNGPAVAVPNGSVTMNAFGQLIFTPAANYNGVTNFSYTVSAGGTTETANVRVTVAAINDAPSATIPGAQTGAEDTPLIFSSANGNAITLTDVDGDTITTTLSVGQGLLTLSGTAGLSTVTGNGTGTITLSGPASAVNAAIAGLSYASRADYNGTDQLQISVSDGTATVSNQIVNLTLTPVADIAANTVSTAEDTAITIPVLANDSFESAARQITHINGLSITAGGAAIAVPNGAVTLTASGDLVFTPAANYNGPATFNYTVTSGGVTETAAVNVTVTPVNDAPLAVNDRTSTAGNTSLSLTPATLLGNDTDIDGNTLTITSVQNPVGGTVALVGGNVVFTPTVGFTGPATFTYTVSDGNGGASTATVTIDVGASTLAPIVDLDGPSTTTATTAITSSVAESASGTLTGDGSASFTLTRDSYSGFNAGVTFVDGANGIEAVNSGDSSGGNGAVTYTYAVTPGAGTTVETVSISQAAYNTTGAWQNADMTITWTGGGSAYLHNPDGQITNFAHGALIPSGTVLNLRTDPASSLSNSVSSWRIDVPASSVTVAYDGLVSLGAERLSFNAKIANRDYTTTFTENGAAVSIADTDSFTSDSDDTNLERATIVLTNAQAGDLLAVGTLPAGIAFTLDTSVSGVITVTLTGSASKADYANAIEAVTFRNTGEKPSTTDRIITVVVNDGALDSNVARSIIHVTEINDPPVAVANAGFTTNEDTNLTLTHATLLGNDTDADGDALSITSVQGAVGGTVSIVGGNVVFTPAPNYNGPASFTYTISDGRGGTSTATVTLNVQAVNDAPIAVNDAYTTAEDTGLTIAAGTGVLSNDTDVEITRGETTVALKVVSNTAPAHGTLTVNPDGSFSYLPVLNYNGPDSFTYTVIDASGATATATVNLTVTPVNDRPTAPNDTKTTPEDQPISGSIAGTDLDGDSLTYATAIAPANGSIVVNSDGTYTYTPNPNYVGSDTFSVLVSDGKGGTTVATVTVNVTPVNDPPVATGETRTTPEDMPVGGRVVATDLDGDKLTYTVSAAPANGSVVMNADGTYTYTPNANFNGTNSFVVTVSDGKGGVTTATVTVNVTPVNDAPVVTGDTRTTPEDAPVNGAVSATDVDGNPLTFTLATPPSNGTVTVNADGTYTYTPNPNYNGADSFTVLVSDGQGGTRIAPVSIAVTPVNDAPVASGDTRITPEDTPVNGSIVAFDRDGDPLTYTINAAPAHGTVTINPDGTYRYTPAANYNGTDTFTVNVSDGKGGLVTVTATVTITPVNDAPRAGGIFPRTSVDGTAASYNTGGFFSDVDGDALTFTAAGLPAGLSINPTTGAISGTLAANASQGGTGGVHAVTVTARDSSGATVSRTFNWTVTNPAPSAANDTATTTEDTSVTIGVLANDSDPDKDPLTVTTATALYGTVAIKPDGALVYTPNQHFNETDTITYTISDGNGGAATATVTVTVTPANDVPTAPNNTHSTPEDTPVSGQILGEDADFDTLAYSVSSAPKSGTVVLNPDGTYTYTPALDFNGTDTFTVLLDDGKGGTSTATVTVTVGGLNDTPIGTAIGDQYRADGNAYAFPAGNYFRDPDGDALTYTITGLPAGLSYNTSTGLISGTIAANASQLGPMLDGSYPVVITATDPSGAATTLNYVIHVENIAPLAGYDTETTFADTILGPLPLRNIISNDTDPDMDALIVATVAGAAGNVGNAGSRFRRRHLHDHL